MTTTTGAAPMSAAEVLAAIDEGLKVLEEIAKAFRNNPENKRLAGRVRGARRAVSAMAEREAALVNEVEALRADAERYRWLRSQARMDPDMGGNNRWYSIYLRGDVRGPTLEVAIDAARAEASKP